MQNHGPNTLLLFYVITCIIKKFKDIYKTYIVIPPTSPSRQRIINLCIVKGLFQFFKLIFMLFFLKQQGLLPEPNLIYIIFTFLHYISTEPIYIKIFPFILKLLNIEKLDGLETLYAPVILNYFNIVLSSILFVILLTKNYLILSVTLFYYTIVLNYMKVQLKLMRRLNKEKMLLAKFKKATKEQIDKCKDVCPICLQNLKNARITNCSHLFHANCLRKWCRLSNECPLCKSFMYNTFIIDLSY